MRGTGSRQWYCDEVYEQMFLHKPSHFSCSIGSNRGCLCADDISQYFYHPFTVLAHSHTKAFNTVSSISLKVSSGVVGAAIKYNTFPKTLA